MSGVATPSDHFVPTHTFRRGGPTVPAQRLIHARIDGVSKCVRPDLDHLGLFWCVGFVFVLVMGGLGLGFG